MKNMFNLLGGVARTAGGPVQATLGLSFIALGAMMFGNEEIIDDGKGLVSGGISNTFNRGPTQIVQAVREMIDSPNPPPPAAPGGMR